MSKRGSIAVSVVALGAMTMSTLLLGQASAAPATEPSGDAVEPQACEWVSEESVSDVRAVSNLEGTFAWNQDAVTGNEELRHVLYEGVSQYLCGVHGNVAEVAQGASSLNQAVTDGDRIVALRVEGDVRNSFAATIEECLDEAPIQTVLGCTCAGNPADGRASANAEVTGFTVAALLERAQPVEEANAITFTAQDGYAVTLPLSYVQQRHSVIVTEVGGAAIDEALGCQNQLWLGATSARSFVRDVVSIKVESLPQEPGVPTLQGLNQPNVGVVEGAVE